MYTLTGPRGAHPRRQASLRLIGGRARVPIVTMFDLDAYESGLVTAAGGGSVPPR
ncbi:hypothetical protein FHR32_001190 [Streptosporangium album]|uniref:Uncharacterized protein n=1 Tax=Streptosporangium album TaxID=47479 RepID=A0A7W7W8E2_9ACTN|nr:hypothetical protein [Streptosporangium album]MBB4936885.1 hypothetical protein [Streptosporangium album]